MSDPPQSPVAAHLLTGFLGSGKTTLLRQLLAAPELAGTAVLVNEFGEVGLDHLLLEAVDEDAVLVLASGCVCCTIRGDLKAAVLRLFERRHQGAIPPFERMVIETSGLADPTPILATFASDPMLRHQVAIGNVIAVVDAVNGGHNLEAFDEAIKQVAIADRLIVAKIDLVEPATLAGLATALRRVNPTAPLSTSKPGQSAASPDLLESVRDPAVRAREVAYWFDFEPVEHRHGNTAALCIEQDEPLDWAAFGLWLAMLLNRHGAAVLRVKGILHILGSETPVVVHGVQHLVHPPTHLPAWPDGRARTRLVLIVRDLDPGLVERSFRVFMRLGSHPRP